MLNKKRKWDSSKNSVKTDRIAGFLTEEQTNFRKAQQRDRYEYKLGLDTSTVKEELMLKQFGELVTDVRLIASDKTPSEIVAKLLDKHNLKSVADIRYKYLKYSRSISKKFENVNLGGSNKKFVCEVFVPVGSQEYIQETKTRSVVGWSCHKTSTINALLSGLGYTPTDILQIIGPNVLKVQSVKHMTEFPSGISPSEIDVFVAKSHVKPNMEAFAFLKSLTSFKIATLTDSRTFNMNPITGEVTARFKLSFNRKDDLITTSDIQNETTILFEIILTKEQYILDDGSVPQIILKPDKETQPADRESYVRTQINRILETNESITRIQYDTFKQTKNIVFIARNGTFKEFDDTVTKADRSYKPIQQRFDGDEKLTDVIWDNMVAFRYVPDEGNAPNVSLSYPASNTANNITAYTVEIDVRTLISSIKTTLDNENYTTKAGDIEAFIRKFPGLIESKLFNDGLLDEILDTFGTVDRGPLRTKIKGDDSLHFETLEILRINAQLYLHAFYSNARLDYKLNEILIRCVGVPPWIPLDIRPIAKAYINAAKLEYSSKLAVQAIELLNAIPQTVDALDDYVQTLALYLGLPGMMPYKELFELHIKTIKKIQPSRSINWVETIAESLKKSANNRNTNAYKEIFSIGVKLNVSPGYWRSISEKRIASALNAPCNDFYADMKNVETLKWLTDLGKAYEKIFTTLATRFIKEREIALGIKDSFIRTTMDPKKNSEVIKDAQQSMEIEQEKIKTLTSVLDIIRGRRMAITDGIRQAEVNETKVNNNPVTNLETLKTILNDNDPQTIIKTKEFEALAKIYPKIKRDYEQVKMDVDVSVNALALEESSGTTKPLTERTTMTKAPPLFIIKNDVYDDLNLAIPMTYLDYGDRLQTLSSKAVSNSIREVVKAYPVAQENEDQDPVEAIQDYLITVAVQNPQYKPQLSRMINQIKDASGKTYSNEAYELWLKHEKDDLPDENVPTESTTSSRNVPIIKFASEALEKKLKPKKEKTANVTGSDRQTRTQKILMTGKEKKKKEEEENLTSMDRARVVEIPKKP